MGYQSLRVRGVFAMRRGVERRSDGRYCVHVGPQLEQDPNATLKAARATV